MKLKKGSISGLLQSPRNGCNINHSLQGMAFTSTTSDPCVYVFGTSETFSTLTLYVEDLLLLGGHTPVIQKFKPPTGTELYQPITGSLMFLGQCTRNDITYAINQLARAIHSPYDSGQAPPRIGEGSYVPGRYVPGNWQASEMRVGETTPITERQLTTSGYLFMMAGGPLSFKAAL